MQLDNTFSKNVCVSYKKLMVQQITDANQCYEEDLACTVEC